ncbi:hypothetical protein BV898_08820 [Hypsibius exemplaris]|uniref:Uncharacterized protein n=1 Tax=Hypsibius exemplaris TaxID=2072580 RepID=A0A1W0WPH6_HYPEX|nr:hypothetical protein BV898_08820 [Hypsibius exemplaris]
MSEGRPIQTTKTIFDFSHDEPPGRPKLVGNTKRLFTWIASVNEYTRNLVQQLVNGQVEVTTFMRCVEEQLRINNRTIRTSNAWQPGAISIYANALREGLLNGTISIAGLTPSVQPVVQPGLPSGPLLSGLPAGPLTQALDPQGQVPSDPEVEVVFASPALVNPRLPLPSMPPVENTRRLLVSVLSQYRTQSAERYGIALNFVQHLIDGKIDGYGFAAAIQQHLMTVFKPTLPVLINAGLLELRHALFHNRLTIEGIVKPPLSAVTPEQQRQRLISCPSMPESSVRLGELVFLARENPSSSPQINPYQPPPPQDPAFRFFGPFSKFTYNCATCGEPFSNLPDNVMPTRQEWEKMHYLGGDQGCIENGMGNAFFSGRNSEGMSIVAAGIVVEKAHCRLCGGREIDSAKMAAHVRMAHSQAGQQVAPLPNQPTQLPLQQLSQSSSSWRSCSEILSSTIPSGVVETMPVGSVVSRRQSSHLPFSDMRNSSISLGELGLMPERNSLSGSQPQAGMTAGQHGRQVSPPPTQLALMMGRPSSRQALQQSIHNRNRPIRTPAFRQFTPASRQFTPTPRQFTPMYHLSQLPSMSCANPPGQLQQPSGGEHERSSPASESQLVSVYKVMKQTIKAQMGQSTQIRSGTPTLTAMLSRTDARGGVNDGGYRTTQAVASPDIQLAYPAFNINQHQNPPLMKCPSSTPFKPSPGTAMHSSPSIHPMPVTTIPVRGPVRPSPSQSQAMSASPVGVSSTLQFHVPTPVLLKALIRHPSSPLPTVVPLTTATVAVEDDDTDTYQYRVEFSPAPSSTAPESEDQSEISPINTQPSEKRVSSPGLPDDDDAALTGKKSKLDETTDDDVTESRAKQQFMVFPPSPGSSDGDLSYLCQCLEVFTDPRAVGLHSLSHVEKHAVAVELRTLYCQHSGCCYLARDDRDFAKHQARHIVLQMMFRTKGGLSSVAATASK